MWPVLVVAIVITILIIIIVVLSSSGKAGLNHPCSNQNECDVGLVCSQSASEGKCLPGLGQSCPAGLCAAGLTCNNVCVFTLTTTRSDQEMQTSSSLPPSDSPNQPPPNIQPNPPPNPLPKDSLPPEHVPSSTPQSLPSQMTSSTADSAASPLEEKKIIIVSNKIPPQRISTENYSNTSTRETSAGTGCSQAFDVNSDSTSKSPRTPRKQSLIVPSSIHIPKRKKHKHELPLPDIIDACSFSDNVVLITKRGLYVCPLKDKHHSQSYIPIDSNIPLQLLHPFGGYLYGVHLGTLYMLCNDTYNTKEWIWKACKWSPIGIQYISSSHNNEVMCIHTNDTHYTYDNKLSLIREDKGENKRIIYGNDSKVYLTIDDKENTAVLMPENTLFSDVYDAVITPNNNIVIIDISNKDVYSRLRLINWVPTYIPRMRI